MSFKSVFIVTFLALPTFVFGSESVFSRNLHAGMSGDDVRTLQIMLNKDATTLVADTGPGSPGNETSYFGAATLRAVVKFQNKYKNEVLSPVGLLSGTGIFGFQTRAQAEKILATLSARSNVRPAATTTITTSQNPNLENIEPYISAIKQEGLKQGLSPVTLSYIEQKIRTEAATTTRNFQKEFYDGQKSGYEKKISINISQSPIEAFFKKVLTAIGGTLFAQKVYASLGIPFGGYLTYVNPVICDCPPGIVTQLFVALPGAAPEISNLLLNYINGSEAFAWHNIPMPGIAVLGAYIPAVPSCWTYVGLACVLIPSEGQITPEVGSSAL